MVLSTRPTNNGGDIRLITGWQPANSETILRAYDMTTDQLLHLVRWGNRLYLPVTEGLRLGIGIYNDSDTWKAYPTYIEAKNLYDNGPSDPNDCTPADMWEVRPRQKFIMDALKNGDHHTARPLVIVPNGMGMGIGEATYGTDEYRGQIRVYERSAFDHTTPRPNSLPGYTSRGGSVTRSGSLQPPSGERVTRSATPPPSYHGGTKGFGGATPRSTPEVGTSHQVGIGAGAEEVRESYETGVEYRRDARLVAALCIESRLDLAKVLRAANVPHDLWCSAPGRPNHIQTWMPQMPVAPHIPVAPEPHRPFGTNRGGSAY